MSYHDDRLARRMEDPVFRAEYERAEQDIEAASTGRTLRSYASPAPLPVPEESYGSRDA